MNRNDREFIAQKIRTQYTEKGYSDIDELKELDKKVKLPANLFSYIFGSIAAIIMGCGMSLVMTDIGSAIGISDPLIPGIVIGCVGLLMAVTNYPIYTAILRTRRNRYAARIIELSDRIMQK